MKAIKASAHDHTHSALQEFLRGLPLFYHLPEDEIAHFANYAHIKIYRKGQSLYREGESSLHFFAILNGWVKLSHVTQDGEQVVVAMLTKNDTTGESSIFEKGNFASSAQVVENAQILSLPLALLKEQMTISNQLAHNMLTTMYQYQRRHEMFLEQFMLYSAPQRVGCFILGLCPLNQQIDGVNIHLPYDKSLIANTLGMRGATFSRALNMLRDGTGIKIEGNNVTVTSMSRLLEFVNGCYSAHNPRL